MEAIRLISEGKSKKFATEMANCTPIERMGAVADPDAVKKVLDTTVLAKINKSTVHNVPMAEQADSESAFVVTRGKIRRKGEHLM